MMAIVAGDFNLEVMEGNCSRREAVGCPLGALGTEGLGGRELVESAAPG